MAAAAAAAAGSQLVFVPACHYTGGLASARLLVVPVGTSLPAGTLRLATSTARPRRGVLPSPALPRFTTVSVPSSASASASASAAVTRPFFPDLHATEPTFLAQAKRRFNTVAYGAHGPATGAGDEGDVSEDSGADASNAKDDGARTWKENGGVGKDDDGSADSAKENLMRSKDDDGSADSAKENLMRSKDDDGSADSSKENFMAPKDDGAASAKQNLKLSKDDSASSAKQNLTDDGLASAKDLTASTDDGAASAKETLKASTDDGAASVKENLKASTDDGAASAEENLKASTDDGAASAKENLKASTDDGAASASTDDWASSWNDKYVDDVIRASKQWGKVSKDDGADASKTKENGARASKENGGVSQSDGGAGSGMENDKDSDDEGADGNLQGRIDPRMIVAELDLYGLGYDPMDNVWHVSAICQDKIVLHELHFAMRSCNQLLVYAMNRRPPLAERAKELVVIGKSFRVVAKEVTKGFVQSVSVLRAVEGLKALCMLFLGPYIGFLKPMPNRELSFKPPEGSGEKLYFNMLLDYYRTVFECVHSEILGLISMDGQDNNFEDFD